ncbi:HlyD family secretion protein [Aureimonas sp. ME7]|uniref:HlyD family secretion protein n=1 Tax=Aureimonas sp. ME7 TaxID=2744252 RepID=UPI001FCECA4E|nr:HlyD family secretion protein [Aureimonas sp. ME7]
MDDMQTPTKPSQADEAARQEAAEREAMQGRVSELATDATPVVARTAEPPAPAPEPASTSAPAAVPVEAPKKLKPKRATVFWMALVALVAVGIILYAWRLGPFAGPVVSTENAYVRGQITVLAPQVNGYVTDVLVRDFAHVKAGDPLVKIDDRIYAQAVAQAEAAFAQAEAALDNNRQTVAQNRAEIVAKQAARAQAGAELERAKADAARAGALSRDGLKPQSETDQVVATLRTAEAGIASADAAVSIAREVLRSTEVSRKGLEASVQSAQAQIDLARINFGNTVVHAPRDGQISEASVRPGQYVSAGSQLMFLVPDTLWVVANFKETQVHYVAVGQPASFSVDALGRRLFRGRVVEIAPATGSEFSVLRADNASGNFTKVVQRLPVRIAIDGGQGEAERLRPGMSVVAHVDTTGAAPEAGSGWAERGLQALREWKTDAFGR